MKRQQITWLFTFTHLRPSFNNHIDKYDEQRLKLQQKDDVIINYFSQVENKNHTQFCHNSEHKRYELRIFCVIVHTRFEFEFLKIYIKYAKKPNQIKSVFPFDARTCSQMRVKQ